VDFQSAGTLDRGETLQDPFEETAYPVGNLLYVPGAWPGAGTLENPLSQGNVSYEQIVKLVRNAPVLSFVSEEGVGVVIALQQGGSVSVEVSPIQGGMRRAMPSQENFEYLARHDAPRLLRWIASGDLPDAALTFAAEAAGLIANSIVVVTVLLPLLGHTSAPVREGAVYGLQRHLSEPRARDALRHAADADESAGVREAAQEALEQLED